MNGVYSIENPWEDFPSVEPVLRLVTEHNDAPLKHHTAGDSDRFSQHFERWANRADWDYAILYLGFHGFSSGVTVAPDDRSDGNPPLLWDHVRLDQIADYAEARAEKWNYGMVHFASCATMDSDADGLRRFLDRTGLVGVSGYTKDVGWIESLAFEGLYINTLLKVTCDAYIRENHLRVCRDRIWNSEYAKALADALGFHMLIRGD